MKHRPKKNYFTHIFNSNKFSNPIKPKLLQSIYSIKLRFPKLKLKINKNQLHNLTLFLKREDWKKWRHDRWNSWKYCEKSTFKNKHQILLIDFNKLNV